MTASSSCPSSLVLLRLALCPEEAEESIAQHVSGCADCRRRVAEQKAQGDAYASSPSADALRQQLKDLDDREVRPDRRAGPPVWAWGGALAAAASLALFFSGAGQEGIVSEQHSVGLPDEPSFSAPLEPLSPKGGAQLGLWIEDGAEASVPLSESAVLHPGQCVQPTFGAPKSGFVALLLTTPAGVVVPLHPAGREHSAPLPAGPPVPLGPSFRLDEEVGTYQVTAYFSKASFSTKDLLAQDPKREGSFAGVVSTRKFEVRR